MSKTIEIPDIAQWEDTDSELAKYTIGKLEEENKKLQERINKATSYMEKNMIDREINCYRIDQIDVRKLLEILKGSEENDK